MTASVFRKIRRLLTLRSDAAPARRRPGPVLLWLLATVLSVAPFTASAQLNLNGRSYDVQGDVAMIGNQLLQCSSNQGSTCHSGNSSNSNYTMVEVDVASVGGGAPANSSTADLSIPAGATILAARLYWAGRWADTGGTAANKWNIWFRTPVGAYTQLTAAAADRNEFNSGGGTGSRPYTASYDVTALVQAGQSGTYAAGGLSTHTTGNDPAGLGFYGGWAIIVLYEHNSKPLRRLMLWDGNGGYLTSGSSSQTVTGLLVPPSGDFSAYMGALVWEGDAGITGDTFQLTGAGILSPGSLSDAASPINNFWNSRISNLGVLNTARNPAHANNYAIDLKLVDISNIPANAGKPRITNGATGATLSFGTTGDAYFPHALVFVADLFRPSVLPSLVKTVANVSRPGAPDVMPGEILEYTIKFGNSGQDGAIRVVVTDPIPTGTTYVPNSLSVYRDDGLGIGSATPRSDASGDDQGEFNGSQVVFRVGSGADAVNGGMLAQNQQVELRFRVTVNPDFLGPTLTNVVSLTHGSQTFPNDPDQTITGNTNSTIPLLIPPVAAQTVVKSAATLTTDADGTTTITEGDTLTYTVTVTNTGDMPLTNVTVNDAQLSPNTTTCLSVAVGGTCVLTGTHVVTAAEAQAGQVVNTGNTTSDQIAGPTNSNTVTTPAATSADVRVLKTLDTAGPYVAGQTVSYTLQVFNDGPSAATNVQVTDVPTNLTITNVSGACAVLPCTIATLASGASATITVTATITASGAFDNSATATGAENDPTPGNNTDDTGNGGVSFIPSLSLDKSAGAPVDVNGNGITDAGDTIAYTFVVTNTGGVPLTAVVVNDPKLSGTPIPCTPATIPVGGTANCGPVTYVVTAADVAAGTVHNSASATGTPPGGMPPVTSAPDTTDTPTTAPAPSLASNKVMTGYDDSDGNGSLSLGDVMHYTITVTNTGNVSLQNVVVSDARLTPASITCAVVPVAGTCVLAGTSLVTQADVDAGQALNTAIVTTGSIPGGGTLPPESCPAGSTDADCSPSTSTPIVQHPAIATLKVATLTVDKRTLGVANVDDVITYTVTATNVGNVTLTNVTVVDTLDGYAPTTLTCTPTTLAPGQTATCTSYSHTVTVADASRPSGLLNNQVVASGNSVGGASVTVTALGNAAVMMEPDPVQIRVVKTSSQRDVKIGDLIRYTLTIQNTGTMPLVGGTIVDTPPPGFTYVDGSLTVDDDDDAGLLTSTYPIAVDQIDVGVGQTATVQYLLRVGAGVRGGAQTNTVQIQDHGKVVSNVATAVVQLTVDPMLDESLILGTVFDDRDGDGWQDSAALSGVHVQGGFAPGAYVPNSTTVDRGEGEKPEPDASAPMLHGLTLGAISGRESDGDPAAKHRVVISQVLSTLEFTGDFVLTSAEGLTVRMNAAGETTVERSGKAQRGLTAAEPTVRRSVSQVANGYRVDYVIENAGVDEHGIPGVRIASVEGLLVETDQYGRYHLTGVDGGRWERGRNFILKVDAATLPPGSVLTTDNPLVRRITPGLPVRFDFGVKLPDGRIHGANREVELEIGTVLFDPDSATLRSQYLPVIEAMAAQIRENGAGEVVLAANGQTQALAYDRAKAVRELLLAKLDPALAQATTISVRTDLADPGSALLRLGESPVLGTVLFDTDQSVVKPEFVPVIEKIAADIEAMGGGVVGVVGHADRRGSDAYNVALGLRRAKAVYEAIAQRLSPQARARLRVEISADPTAPVGRQSR